MVEKYLNELMERYSNLTACRGSVMKAYEKLEKCFTRGGKLLVAGNGGSAADAEHIVGELMKGFIQPRKIDGQMAEKLKEIDSDRGMQLAEKLQNALPAVAFCNHNSLNTAFANDVDGSMCFAQQVYGYGMAGDILLAISTSGNSRNIIYAAITAKAKGVDIIGMTGKGGGKLASVSDVVIDVNETETYKVQELHVPIYHCICMMLEEHFFTEHT